MYPFLLCPSILVSVLLASHNGSGEFFSFLFHGLVQGGLVSALNPPVNLSGPEFAMVGRFLITASISIACY